MRRHDDRIRSMTQPITRAMYALMPDTHHTLLPDEASPASCKGATTPSQPLQEASPVISNEERAPSSTLKVDKVVTK